MSTLTVVLEVVLGFIGRTIVVGVPLIGMRLHQRDDEPVFQPPLVGSSRDVARALAVRNRELVTA
ncbi:MAG TPA: hypothetical protein VND83_04230 [Acidimicrobiales bacterium]|nr:hypothetical protein [Acidimicrobiales bacterium]